MPRWTVHVVPDPNGGWNIKKGGSRRPIGHSDTKQPAIDTAREISRKLKAELFIHNKDGRISRKDSHGHDPYPPKG